MTINQLTTDNPTVASMGLFQLIDYVFTVPRLFETAFEREYPRSLTPGLIVLKTVIDHRADCQVRLGQVTRKTSGECRVRL